jgi:[amino group carrier protein]-lysine/ornithine hydrolase
VTESAGINGLPGQKLPEPDSELAVRLLRELVEIESLSGKEQRAVEYLVAQMAQLGYASHVDSAGSAVGILEPRSANGPVTTIVLLGHIDTVPGRIPVRVEDDVLYGRGSVDAKGPLATMVMAGALARLADTVRLVVAGAVEEESASSRGARQIARDYRADYCVIGEPSGAGAVTLGYKGRLLVDFDVALEEGHTAGPCGSAAELAAGFWERLQKHAREFNESRSALFDQLLPSLRYINSSSDGLTQRARALMGVRLPPGFDVEAFTATLSGWADAGKVSTHGHELAWQSERSCPLVRHFTRAMSAEGLRMSCKLKTGTSDMNVVGPVWNCPIVAYGPGDSKLDHTPREHVRIGEYLQAICVLRNAISSMGATTA